MDVQLKYAKLLHASNYGIALKKPCYDINVGDLCYWDQEGKATRILNIFDNDQWLRQQQWPELNVKKDAAVDVSKNMSLPIIHGGGCWWGITPAQQGGVGFDLCFHRLAQEVAVMVPSAPCTIIGFRPAAQLAIEQWWAQAKRNAFRTWSHLIGNPTGIFLVTKCVKTKRLAQCLSSGPQGQQSRIHVQGLLNFSRSNNEVELTSNGTEWQLVRNEMDFNILRAEDRKEYTIFIERAASRMFGTTDVLKAAAQRLWATCMAAGTPQAPGTPWVASSHPGWAPPQAAPAAPAPPPGPPNPAAATAVYDGRDRLTLQNNWFLIKGGDDFFLEHASVGLDIQGSEMTTDAMLKILGGPPPPPQAAIAPPPPIHPPPIHPPPPFQPPPPQVPHGGPPPIFNPPAPGPVNPPPHIPQAIPPGPGPFQFPINPPIPVPAPPVGNVPPMPFGGGPVPHNPHGPIPYPVQFPIPPHGQIAPQPLPAGVAAMSAPLVGAIPRVNAAAIGAQPIPPPPDLPNAAPGVLPSYAGFTFANGGEGGGPRIINIQPITGNTGPNAPRARMPGMNVDIPWGWN